MVTAVLHSVHLQDGVLRCKVEEYVASSEHPAFASLRLESGIYSVDYYFDTMEQVKDFTMKLLGVVLEKCEKGEK